MSSIAGLAVQSLKSMERLFIDQKHRPLFAALGWSSVAAIANHFLSAALTSHRAVIVQRGKIEHDGKSLDVFFKQYEFESPSWAFLWRASKARREFENYEVFAR